MGSVWQWLYEWGPWLAVFFVWARLIPPAQERESEFRKLLRFDLEARAAAQRLYPAAEHEKGPGRGHEETSGMMRWARRRMR